MPSRPGDDLGDIERLRRRADRLADAIAEALPRWVEDSVARLLVAWSGRVDPDVAARATAAGASARDQVLPELRTLLAQDIDDQRTTPLSLIRQAVPYPTDVLRDAGVPPVERDERAVELYPDDVYDLGPAAFADLGPGVHEAGIEWGAAKAFVHLERRREGGSDDGRR